MNMQYQKINSQEELDKLIKEVSYNYPLECFVALGMGRSSKNISLDDNGDYWVYNEIDDSEDIIKHSQLMESFIGEAISKGALYKY